MGNLFSELMAVKERRAVMSRQVREDMASRSIPEHLLTEEALDRASAELTRVFQKFQHKGYDVSWDVRAVVEEGKLRVQLSTQTTKTHKE